MRLVKRGGLVAITPYRLTQIVSTAGAVPLQRPNIVSVLRNDDMSNLRWNKAQKEKGFTHQRWLDESLSFFSEVMKIYSITIFH
jgi:hypothetical protein